MDFPIYSHCEMKLVFVYLLNYKLLKRKCFLKITLISLSYYNFSISKKKLMKKVLIAIDYSPKSEIVALKGYALAKKLGASVGLLHIISNIGYYGMQYPSFLGFSGYALPIDPNLPETLHKVAKEYMLSAKAHLGDPNIETHIETGDTADAILKFSSEWNADILVMGTHSHSTLEKLFMGTVASNIIEKTKVPVYLIPVGQ